VLYNGKPQALQDPARTYAAAETVLTLTVSHILERWHAREKELADAPALLGQLVTLVDDFAGGCPVCHHTEELTRVERRDLNVLVDRLRAMLAAALKKNHSTVDDVLLDLHLPMVEMIESGDWL
jgi:hypothetical protein